MPVSIPSFLNAQTQKLLSQTQKLPSPSLPFSFSHSQQSQHTLKFLSTPRSFAPSLQSSLPIQNGFHLDDDDDDPHVIGDCLVFEEGIFEDPYLNDSISSSKNSSTAGTTLSRSKKKKAVVDEIKVENLVPENWRELQAEINITKKQRRKIAQEMEFNSRLERKKRGLPPIRSVNMEEYQSYKEAKLAQLKPLVLDNPVSFKEDEEKEEEQGEDEEEEEEEDEEENVKVSERVAPKNPRWAVYGRGLDDVTEFFSSASYEPGEKKTEGRRKLFTKEEKVLLNKKIPDLAVATSNKWLPLHTLAASGEFYLMDALLKRNVGINAVDMDGLTALHKAVICRKQAITSYLLRESADPFARDMDGASLMHYAVQTASTTAVKHLLLYNVDINLQDNDGWTPLHLAVQGRRTDMVKLLLIKGADKTLKNHDGLTPLDLCLYSGQDTRTCELIKLLKQLPRKPTALRKQPY